MPSLTRVIALAIVLIVGPSADAAVVAIYNSTERPVSFSVGHPGKPAASYTFSAGESRLVSVGRQPNIAFTSLGKTTRFRLEPYHAYAFAPDQSGVQFHGIDLAGALPPPNDVPADPPAFPSLKLAVALLADDNNFRARDAWERVYRARIAAASAILERQCGVGLVVTSVGEWKSDPTHGDLLQQAKIFEKATVPAGALAIGFTSRYPKADAKTNDQSTGFCRSPLWPFILVRDGLLRTEPERVEVVVREVGHYLGAAHTPDPLSAMRGDLAAGRGLVGRYPIGIDPLNLLAVAIWVEEMRSGSPKSIADLKQLSRERLAVYYKTLSGLLPTDELAPELLAALERVGAVAAVPPAPEPLPAPKVESKPKADPTPARKTDMPTKADELQPKPVAQSPMPKVEIAPKPVDAMPAPKVPAVPTKQVDPPPVVVVPPKPSAPRTVDRTEAVRKVVTAVRLRAVDLKRDQASDKAKGDALTVELLMTAGDIAYSLDGPLRVPAFLIGIGVALDDSDTLRKNILFASMMKAIETDSERAERIAALGAPTLLGRRDLCQHFAVSAALAELLGPKGAESAGVLKEMLDRDGVSGFSFADLAADFAGIQLAAALNKFPEALGRFRDGVNLPDYMPSIKGLREGLPAAKFKELYGDLDDPRFKAELAMVKKRVADMPKYKEIAELKVK